MLDVFVSVIILLDNITDDFIFVEILLDNKIVNFGFVEITSDNMIFVFKFVEIITDDIFDLITVEILSDFINDDWVIDLKLVEKLS